MEILKAFGDMKLTLHVAPCFFVFLYNCSAFLCISVFLREKNTICGIVFTRVLAAPKQKLHPIFCLDFLESGFHSNNCDVALLVVAHPFGCKILVTGSRCVFYERVVAVCLWNINVSNAYFASS